MTDDMTDDEYNEWLRTQADPVDDGQYWTQGLDIAPKGEPMVHRDLRGKLNIRVSDIPSIQSEELICWVEIIEGDLFNGIGKLIVDMDKELLLDEEIVEPEDIIYYQEGSQDRMPRYAGIHEKNLKW